MNSLSDVVIVGAGPYGLSMAAHLKAKRVDYRIFGTPMRSWYEHCPKGMRLKSEGFASDLHAPGGAFPLSQYCAEHGIPYADVGVPISADTFVKYGLEFQRRYVPELEERQVTRLEQAGEIFRLWLDSGECVEARAVVVGTGLHYYSSIPKVLAGLSDSVLSHSWNCSGLGDFADRHVAVIGAGASALNCAAALLHGKASVSLLARRKTIDFQSPPDPNPRSLRERIRWPQTGLGMGWRSVLSCEAPSLIRRLPVTIRHDFVRNHLGPAPGWFVREQVVGPIEFQTGVTLSRAEMRGDRAVLHATRQDGERLVVEADHVVAATGFDIDARKLAFLSPKLLSKLRMENFKPALSANFESSVPGLYIVGPAAASSFGPLLRFAFGAGFAAHRVSRHLAPSRARPRRTWSPAASTAQVSSVKT
ncbi:MAG: NAD(P)-binding domain-containing protein [Acetobacteraceae bacterium]|jgi:cation diffusion facilitator CzcD-associated flavoprotein CzcO